MDLASKLRQLIDLQNSRLSEKIGAINGPISERQIHRIERLLEEPLSPEFLELYSVADGQVRNANGALFDERLISSDEIVERLQRSRDLVKPKQKSIPDEVASNKLLRKIVDSYLLDALRAPLAIVENDWFKLVFDCSPNSGGGPYLYHDENSTAAKVEILEIDFEALMRILTLVRELHSLEKETYNWDQLNFVVFPNGDFEVERTFYDFENELPLTSTPAGAIRKKYFHWKWLPLFSDNGGNYIGIDFDPDIKGRKGQIITFGRDVEDMFVVAENLNEFFDLLLSESKDPNSPLFDENLYLPDILKEFRS